MTISCNDSHNNCSNDRVVHRFVTYALSRPVAHS